MVKTTLVKTLKDGIIIRRNVLALNVNKDRRYSITYNGKTLYANLLYSELQGYIAYTRTFIE